jgi:uncharacterized phiE125 gp8 family phage protein
MQLTPRITITRDSAPSAEPVSLHEAKLFLRVEHDAEDGAIQQMIATAREVAEQILNRSLLMQRWVATLYSAPAHRVGLSFGPVSAIVSVTYYDDAGAATIADTESYRLSDPYTIQFEYCPSAARTEIRYDAGMAATPAALPSALKQNILQHVAYLYGFRSLDESQRIQDITRLYAPFREVQL